MQTPPSFVRDVLAPAKINLCLHVLGRRQDGFHELQSLVVFADLGDRLRISAGQGSAADSLVIDGPFSGDLHGEKDNLVLKALHAMKRQWPGLIPGPLRICLQKNLPVASGIGGGSADAAAMLRVLAEEFVPAIEQDRLHEIALLLGSDIPACLSKKPLIMSGRGENLTLLEKFPSLFAVLANPGITISTGRVFSGLKSRNNPPLKDLPANPAGPLQLVDWLRQTRNDLQMETIALVPGIGELIGEFEKNPDCMLARMSGSGATVFALFADLERARAGARRIRQRWPGYWVQPTILSGSGGG